MPIPNARSPARSASRNITRREPGRHARRRRPPRTRIVHDVHIDGVDVIAAAPPRRRDRAAAPRDPEPASDRTREGGSDVGSSVRLEMHCVAIDWSGAKAHGGRRDIALAECVDGRLVGIREGISRGDVQRWLLRRAAEIPDLVVGLDFAFSLPAWFIRDVLHASDVFGAWDVVAREAEAWLAGAAPWPFWGRGAQAVSTNLASDSAFRQTERDVAGITSTNPKSVFQLIGSGQVGPGSLRGIPMLRELRAAGFAIWPFDGFGLPLVTEIYPRVLTGDVVKRNLDARTEFLARFANIDRDIAARAAATEHAFDAACSAIVMSRHNTEFEQMCKEPQPYGIEGKIWVPAFSPADEAKPRASVAPVLDSQRRAVPEVRPAMKHGAGASTIVSDQGPPMVRVMRKARKRSRRHALRSARRADRGTRGNVEEPQGPCAPPGRRA